MALQTKNDRLLEVVGMVVVAAIMTTLDDHPQPWWLHYAIGLSFTAIIWEANRYLLLRMQARFDRPDQTLRRLLVQVPLHFLITVAISATIELVLVRLLLGRSCTQQDVLRSIGMSLVPTAFVALLYESRFFFNQWRQYAVRVEQLARVQVQSQLEALRNQVDPHFLFNSLNTLAALIDEDAEAAQQYLSQLADVYRYVLLARERDTVPLHEEMAFVEAYLALNKARFRDNLLVMNSISPAVANRFVAPLSIQTLVENALKHNVISREHPLTLQMESAGPDAIRVVNSVRPKGTLTSGTRLGLRNLVSRYALLTATPVMVKAGAEEFMVELPLL